MDGVVRVLEFTIGAREFTGIASFLYQYYKRIDRNRVRLDFFFCRQNSMDLVKDDVIFDNSKFFVLNAIKDITKTMIIIRYIMNSKIII